MSVKVTSSNSSHIVVCIYRPPGNVSESFCDQFSDHLDQLFISGKQYIICGDLNCPGDGETQIDRHLQHVLTSYNQLQLVVGPTHDAGHTLDLLILPEVQRNWVSDVDIQSLCFSDHSLVRCRFGAALHRSPVISFSYRRLKQINLTAFRRDIAGSLLFDPTAQDNTIQYNTIQYNNHLVKRFLIETSLRERPYSSLAASLNKRGNSQNDIL